MYLTMEQIKEYAERVLEKLGEVVNVRDVIYGGTEYSYRYYRGYSLTITDRPGITIRHGDRRVFGGEDMIGGQWELVLKELYEAIPKILSKREKRRLEKEREKEFVHDCEKYVLEWSSHVTFSGTCTTGNYSDDIVEICSDGSWLRIYEKRQKGFMFWKKDSVLVYSTNESDYDEIRGNGYGDDLWRCHVEGLIERGKQRALRRDAARRTEKARALARETDHYLEELRNM